MAQPIDGADEIRGRVKTIIRDWMLYHVFEDDCGYPLISPSDVVLDDLVWRLDQEGDTNAVRKNAEVRWAQIPPCKGKEKRLRRLRRPEDHKDGLPSSETWYCWMELRQIEPNPPRLMVPWSDPREHEFPMDWLFRTPEEARAAKKEHAPYEDWILIRKIFEPIERDSPKDEESNDA